jgi:small subunit ribosomal protein S15
MTLNNEFLNKFRQHDKDTGSIELQVGSLTTRISSLASHLKENHKDQSSKLSLMKMLGKRKRFLGYLEKNDYSTFKKVKAEIKTK